MPSEESMIEDLREIEQELRENDEHRKANIIDLFIQYSTHCKIPKDKIMKIIKELNIDIERNERNKEWIEKSNDNTYINSLILYEPEIVKQRLLNLLED